MEHSHEHHHHHNVENEKKTLIVIILTIITMIAEIAFGFFTNSMALLSDGMHMGTHAFAFAITYFAYLFMRKIEKEKNAEKVSHKVSALAGYTSSLFLALTAFWIVIESVERLINPLKISFNQAILVAVIGLIVNLICVFIMENGHKTDEKDFNFKSAYLHILTDAMTSLFAIFALLAGKYFGLYFLDPFMGFVGAWLIFKWSFGLIKETFKILSDINLLSKDID